MGKMQELGQIGEIWWRVGKYLKDELVQVVLWRNDKLECSTSELHAYFSKLTKAKTKKQSFVYFNLKSDLKLEKCRTILHEQKIMWENHGTWIRNYLSMWIQTNINFSNSKYHTSNCIGSTKTVFLVAAVVPWPQIMVPRRAKGDEDLLVAFLDLFLLLQQTT